MAHTHPLLEMLVPRRAASASVGDQIASLTHEVAKLATQARRYTAPRVKEAAHEASDFAGEVLHQIEPYARDFAQRARAAGKVVRDDPLPAIIALGTFALIATLVLRRQ